MKVRVWTERDGKELQEVVFDDPSISNADENIEIAVRALDCAHQGNVSGLTLHMTVEGKKVEHKNLRWL